MGCSCCSLVLQYLGFSISPTNPNIQLPIERPTVFCSFRRAWNAWCPELPSCTKKSRRYGAGQLCVFPSREPTLSHLWKRNIIVPATFKGDMLVSSWVHVQKWCQLCHLFHVSVNGEFFKEETPEGPQNWSIDMSFYCCMLCRLWGPKVAFEP